MNPPRPPRSFRRTPYPGVVTPSPTPPTDRHNLPKPILRGRLHQAAFFAAVPAAALLIGSAPNGTSRAAAIVYGLSLIALFGASAMYHRGDWSPRVVPRLRRLDHSMIFVLIAGTYTPFCLLALPSPWSWIFLGIAWAGALGGIALKLLQIDGFKRTSGALYIALGWVIVFAGPLMVTRLTGPVMALLAVGGILYTVGAVVLATNRPNPSPRWFGYHEIWHSFTVAAGACHYIAVILLFGLVARNAVG
jgi:hemolysin III